MVEPCTLEAFRHGTMVRSITTDPRPIVVAGLPRSGSTWLARTLAVPPDVAYVHEPENVGLDRFAMVGLRGMPFPDLEPGDDNDSFELLWRLALHGGWPPPDRATTALKGLSTWLRVPRVARVALAKAAARRTIRRAAPPATVVVKTVRSHLSLAWLDERFAVRITVVWRHPLNVVSSWAERGYPEPGFTASNRRVRSRFESTPAWPAPEKPFEGMVWAVCAQNVLLLEDAAAHPDWLLVAHEETAGAPVEEFSAIYRRLGLLWDDAVVAHLAAHDRPGEKYAVMRIAHEEARRWQHRLTSAEASRAIEVVDTFAALSTVAGVRWSSSPATRS